MFIYGNGQGKKSTEEALVVVEDFNSFLSWEKIRLTVSSQSPFCK